MGSRTTIPFEIPAGVVKAAGPIEGRARWIDCDHVRFKDGKAEKIEGWDALTSVPMEGMARAAHAWSDTSDDSTEVAIGTTSQLYYLDEEYVPVAITPWLRRWRQFGAFSTTATSATVTVHHPGHNRNVGDTVVISDTTPDTIAGLNLEGTFTVASVVDTSSYTITAGGTATSSVEEEGWATITYPHVLTGAFSVTNGSPTVTLHHVAHGAIVGQRLTFLATGSVPGALTLSGVYTVTSVPNANSLTFTASDNANATTATTGTCQVIYGVEPGEISSQSGGGFGEGDYGEEDYGTARSAAGSVYFQPSYWTLANFGRYLMAVPMNGTIYVWDPATPAIEAQALAGAPGGCRGVFVTPERFIVAWGAGEGTDATIEPMLLRWSDQADMFVWTPDEFNASNSRRLTEGQRIMGAGVIGEGLSMVWTDTASYTMRYTGSRFVYETRIAATGAGIVGPHAWTSAHGRAYWFGNGNFWAYSGGVDRLPGQEAILPWLQAQLSGANVPKTVCFYNQPHNEVWWIFPTYNALDDEPDLYIIFNLTDGSWSKGSLSRTAFYQYTTAGNIRPHLVGTDGIIYIHETGADANGAPLAAYVETGPFMLEEGEGLVSVVGFVPDFSERVGDVTITLKMRDRAPGAVFETDVLTATNGNDELLDARIRGRVMALRYEQEVLEGSFAIGSPGIQLMSGGRKR